MVALRWEGLTKYQEEIEEEKRWQEKLDLEKKDQELREKELDIKERTLDFKILKNGQDLAIEILKSMGITGLGTLSTSDSKSSSGGINLVNGEVSQASNKKFMRKIQDRYGVTDEAFTRLLGSTNLQSNTFQLLYDALEKASSARVGKNRPVVSKEEIGTFINNIILTEGKPFENAIDVLSKRFPDGMPDFLEQIIMPLTNLTTTTVDLGAFKNVNKMAGDTEMSAVKRAVFEELNTRFLEYNGRIIKARDTLNNIDDNNKTRLDKALEKYLENLSSDLSRINNLQGEERKSKLFYTFGAKDLFEKSLLNFPGFDFPNNFKESSSFKRDTKHMFIPQNLNKQSGANNLQIVKRLTDLGVLEYYNENDPNNFFSQYQGYIEGKGIQTYPNYESANITNNIIPES